jgi:hypothetical protein
VYTYDAIGSYERTGYSCQGSGKDLMQPVLDNQLKAASPLLVPARVSNGRTRSNALQLVAARAVGNNRGSVQLLSETPLLCGWLLYSGDRQLQVMSFDPCLPVLYFIA